MARARGSVAKARASPRNMLRGNWSSRMSSASAPCALFSQSENFPAAAASYVSTNRSRISASKAASLVNQRSGPAWCQNDTIASALAVMGLSVSRVRGSAGFVAEGAPQDFADVGFGEFFAEFDVFGHLVAGETGIEIRTQDFGRNVRIFPDYKELAHFAGMFVGNADKRALRYSTLTHRDIFDFVGEDFET